MFKIIHPFVYRSANMVFIHVGAGLSGQQELTLKFLRFQVVFIVCWIVAATLPLNYSRLAMLQHSLLVAYSIIPEPFRLYCDNSVSNHSLSAGLVFSGMKNRKCSLKPIRLLPKELMFLHGTSRTSLTSPQQTAES